MGTTKKKGKGGGAEIIHFTPKMATGLRLALARHDAIHTLLDADGPDDGGHRLWEILETINGEVADRAEPISDIFDDEGYTPAQIELYAEAFNLLVKAEGLLRAAETKR